MVNFPTSLDTFSNPNPTDPQNSPSHSSQHTNANDAIEALEAKLGVTSSTPTNGKVLQGQSSAGTSEWVDLSVSALVEGETPGGNVNSSNTAYTTAAVFSAGSLRVYKNGVRMKGGGADYTEDGDNQGFTMVTVR